MVINHLLTGMIIQLVSVALETPAGFGGPRILMHTQVFIMSNLPKTN